MAFSLSFYQTTKARNSTFVPPVAGSTTEVLLKDSTSVIRPTFRMRLSEKGMSTATELMQYNYCYCAEFKRYYFIRNITAETAVIFLIECEVDVLATFREDILNTKAFIVYGENSYNSMLPDSRLPITYRSKQKYVKVPTGMVTTDNGCFIVGISSISSSGDTGPVQMYALTQEQCKELANNLYQADFDDVIAALLYNPQNSVVSCMWIPVEKHLVAKSGDVDITFGKPAWKLCTGAPCKRTIMGETLIEPYIEYQTEHYNPETGLIEYNWADYRNCEPYSSYSVWFPGSGLSEIPMRKLIGDGDEQPRFMIEQTVSVSTGDITYAVIRMNNADGTGDMESTVMVVKGNFGVQIPIANSQSGFGSALMSAITAAGSTAVALLAPEASIAGAYATVNAIESLGTGMLESMKISTSATGSIGGWAQSEDMLSHFYCITTVNRISDNPRLSASTIGRPYHKTERLGDVSGLVKCTGAYVETWATEEEHNMIAQFVNSSANYIFGGLIIE